MSDDHRGKPAQPGDKTIIPTSHHRLATDQPTAVGGYTDDDFDNAFDAALGGNTVPDQAPPAPKKRPTMPGINVTPTPTPPAHAAPSAATVVVVPTRPTTPPATQPGAPIPKAAPPSAATMMMSPSPAKPASAPVKTPAPTGDATMVLAPSAQAGVRPTAPPATVPAKATQPSAYPQGTPLPQPIPPQVAPQGQPQPTIAGSSRAKRPSVGPSVGPSDIKPQSVWDTPSSISSPGSSPGSTPGSGGTTGVHIAASRPHPGVRINQYELIKMIGEGGMGQVWVARDLKLGRRVAIKFLITEMPELTQRFLVEARATARCQHENIVIIYEVGEHLASPYMVLEYLSGKPLTAQIKDGGRLPYSRAVEIMVSTLKALEEAHKQGIVHRDLKPDNVFVTDAGQIKVLDFGIAKVLEAQQQGSAPSLASSPAVKLPSPLELATGSNSNLTRHGTIMGTLKYMSPEQWGIGVPIDHLTDIWACGIILHRMICGKHPLAPLDGNQLVVTAMLELPMPSMAEAAPPDVPRELIQIVDRCLLKQKGQRWQSAAELLRALEKFLPGRRTQELQIDESPYTGLSSFQEADAGKFFGRNREIAAMVTRIRDRPLMAVVGSSGVGKSSFVRAGLVPALKRSGEQWETLVTRPGRKPMDALAALVAPMVGTASNLNDEIAEQTKLAARLRQEPGHLGHLLRGRARKESRRIMLFVDQFEELYTQVDDPHERAAYTAALSAVADDATSPLRVVLSIRSDFVDRVAEDQTFLAELTQGLFFLGAPSRDGLRDAIVQPAELAGYRFEIPQIVDDMLGHLETTPGALPLLQFAASKLWDQRDAARKLLTHSSYQQMGGVTGALAMHADSVIQELGQTKAALIRAILLRLVTPERTRAIVPIDELRELSREHGEVQRLIDQMVDARLLVIQNTEGSKGSTVEIVHESLINNWPALRRWLEETQEDAALVDQLRNAARQWNAKGRSADLLWRGDAAEEAKKFRVRYKGPLSDIEAAFLDEIILYEKSVARRKRVAVIGAFAGLGALVIASLIALVIIQKSRIDARNAAKLAEQREKEAVGLKSEAEKQKAEAVKQKAKAEESLAAMERKEQERLAAEEETAKAELEKQKVNTQLDTAQQDLAVKNAELQLALAQARRNEARAKQLQRSAETAQAEAEAAKDQVQAQKDQVQALFKQEQERVKRLQQQIGSPIVDDLK